MPNPIKYSTGSESLALKSGNFYIGTGDVPKGPTSETGYWNGLNPPVSGYTIYVNKESGGPAVYSASNDEELVTLTKIISGQNLTTAQQCLVYYTDQTDKVVINRYYPPIVTDGLIFSMDAGFTPSYPTSGTTWYNLSGTVNSTLFNGPTFNSNGWLVFDGVNDYSVGTGTLGQDCTVELWISSSNYSGRIPISIDSNNYGSGPNIFCTNNIIAWNTGNGGGNPFSNSYYPNAQWHHIVVTNDYNVTAKLYIDGNLIGTANSLDATTTGTNKFWIARFHGDNNYTIAARIAATRIYNTALTEDQVRQNYYKAPIVTDGLVFASDAGNLVSYESGSTTTYSLTGSFTASLLNGTKFSPGFGGTFDLDGVDDFIQIPYNSYWDSNVFGSATTFTISCWVKPDVFRNWDTLISKAAFSTIGGWYSANQGAAIWSDVNGFVAVLSSGVASNPSGSIVQIFYPTTNTQKWYHLCFTGDGTILRFYVDGIQRGTAQVSSRTVPVTTTNVGPAFGHRAYYNGQITNMTFYTKALTAQEVAQNFGAQRSRFNV